MGRAGRAKEPGRRGAARGGERDASFDVGAVSELIRLMDEHQLVEVEIENAGSRIRLVRSHAGLRAAASAASAPAEPAAIDRAPSETAPPPARSNGRPIISPMIGTFYRAPSPDAPAFVDVGSVVDKGDTLCIIEAMKMMNEIEAEFRGRVTRVLAENGQTVEYGEELFLVEPL